MSDINATIRNQWAHFLRPLVENRTTSDGVPLLAELDAARVRLMREEMGYKDARLDLPAMYDYVAGKAAQTVTPRRAFWLGEALRACGFAWCSGVVALVASSQLGAQIDLLDRLGKQAQNLEIPQESYTAALLSVMLAPLVLNGISKENADIGVFLGSAADASRTVWFRALEYGTNGSSAVFAVARTILKSTLPLDDRAALIETALYRHMATSLRESHQSHCNGLSTSRALTAAAQAVGASFAS